MSRPIHVSTNGTILFLFMAEWYFILYIYHIFIHSTVDGHLGYFYNIDIVSSAAVNIGVHGSFWIMALFKYMPKNEIPGSYGRSIIVSLGTSILLSIVALSVYSPANNVKGFSFLYTLSNIYYL